MKDNVQESLLKPNLNVLNQWSFVCSKKCLKMNVKTYNVTTQET